MATQTSEPDPAERIRILEAENDDLRRELEAGDLETRAALKRLYALESHLLERERDLRSILDHMPAMIGYWDRTLRNRFSNHAYCDWFGIDPTAIAGMHLREVLGEESFALNLPYIEGALRGEGQVFERTIPALDNSRVRHFLANFIPDLIDGAVQGFYVLVTDTTALKKVETALREAHAEQEQRVVERTEQLRHLAIQTTLAEERERQAIARDLHDGLGQLLHVVKVKLDLLAKQLPAAAAGTGEELAGLLAEASRMTRSLTTELSPPVLTQLGLAPALNWLGEEIKRQYDLNVAVAIDGPLPRLSPAQSSILFRSARELLINVAKHAGTDRARLALMQRDGQLTLTVEDGGVGVVDVARALGNTQGFGLASIRERLVYLGGKTEIVPGPAGGLHVTLRMPLTQPAARPEPVKP